MTRNGPRAPARPESKPSKTAARRPRRGQSPPVLTNEMDEFCVKHMAAKTPMVVVLDDGEELEGAIEWYDKNALKLARSDQPSLMISKHHIRYIFEEKERRRQQRREARSGEISNGPEAGGRDPSEAD